MQISRIVVRQKITEFVRLTADANNLRAGCLLFLAMLFYAGSASAQCVSLTTLGSAATQNFDTLSSTASSTTNNLTLTGWFLNEEGLGARDNDQYAVDTGGSNTGDTFSYGAAGNTERALGSLRSGTLIPTYGSCYTNNTGSTITSLNIAYNGEQWRIGNTAAARDDRLDFQYSTNATSLTTGTYTDVNALDFTNPIKTAASAAALNGNLAANRTAISNTISSLMIANGATFWIRWTDLDASGADDGLAIDDFSLTPNTTVAAPNLTINDVTLAEGNSGTTDFIFTVSLSAPAGPGGVTFDIATADGTAQDDNPASEDNDYAFNSLTGQTIPAGSSTYNFVVKVNGDITPEANETFFVNVTNVTGATVPDGQGQGTINNDDGSLTPIHDIQGPGNSSPIVGATVTTRGIVTGVKSNGFFIQEPDFLVDADPNTSEGILVFTNSTPPAGAAVGNFVQVTATVTEFVPASDPLQSPLTQLSSPTVSVVTTGNALPAAVTLTGTFPDPAGPYNQLERLEGMRVNIPSFTVWAPTTGDINEANANAISTGVFWGTITGNARPFREPGIQAPDPAPAGSSIPPIPRWDANPELLRVDSDGIGATAINANTGTVLSNVTGPLDYSSRRYTILPETAPTGSNNLPPTAAVLPGEREFTVASYNLERFFDSVNDPIIGEPVLTAGAFDRRLLKASLGIRNYLNMPDILGVVEVENLSTLQAIANRINSDAIAEAQPNPQYVAYLVEGNDATGLDVGFLIKSAPVSGAIPRVEVVEVQQELDNTLFINPDSSTETLYERPPLRLSAIINYGTGESFPVTVIVNNFLELTGANSEAPGSNGWATVGQKIRRKRQAQAENLANFVQGRQTANPSERIVVAGDFNSFEFNDGLANLLGTIQGTPSPDNETAVEGDGIDFVNPNLDNLFDLEIPSERYSLVSEGNAQSFDHILVNQTLIDAIASIRLDHARINADFADAYRNLNRVERLSDQDPIIAYFALSTTDISLSNTDSPDPVTAGSNINYTLTINNTGTAATNVTLSDTIPTGTTFVSLTQTSGQSFTCSTPSVGETGNISCTTASLPNGSASFTLTVAVNSSVAAGTVVTNTANITSSSPDSNPANDSATATTTVTTSANLAVTMTDSPDPVTAGNNLVYTITATNNGPSDAVKVLLTDQLPAQLTVVSLTQQSGPAFSCTTNANPAGFSCTIPTLSAGQSAVFVLTTKVAANTQPGVLTNQVNIGSDTTDPNAANNSATATTTVSSLADLAVTKTASANSVTAGSGNLTYTISVTNNGSSDAAAVNLTDALPAGTNFVSLNAPAGWSCTTPTVGGNGTVSCSRSVLATSTNAVFTLTVSVPANFQPSEISNTAQVSSSTVDPVTANNTSTVVTVINKIADLSVLMTSNSNSVTAGGTLIYSIRVMNNGPSDADTVVLNDQIPSGTTFGSISFPQGWKCKTPASGARGNVRCTKTTAFASGSEATFALRVKVNNPIATGSLITNAAEVSSETFDPNTNNNSAGSTVSVN